MMLQICSCELQLQNEEFTYTLLQLKNWQCACQTPLQIFSGNWQERYK